MSENEYVTNSTIKEGNDLFSAAEKLMEAAYNFWLAHREAHGAKAVVWLEDHDGHFVLFTRGEYRQAILESAKIVTRGEEVLQHFLEEKD